MRYTEEEHARRLLVMLERERPCSKGNCPANQGDTGCRRFSTYGFATVLELRVNNMCKGFIGLNVNRGCPCNSLGGAEAIKRTWLALEEKGYLD